MTRSSQSSEIYTGIVDAVRNDPSLEDALLADFDGTLKNRFGIEVPEGARLERIAGRFHLTLGGQRYDLGVPSQAAPGELNDAELELVSAGGSGDSGDSGGFAMQRDPELRRMVEEHRRFHGN